MSTAVGSVASTTIEWVARVAMQVAQLAFAKTVADRQFQLAQEYSDRATQALESQLALAGQEIALRSYDNAKWFGEGGPCLSAFLAEVCGQPVYTPNYNEEASRALSTIRAAGAIAAKKVFECADTYCIGMSQHAINEIAYKEAALASEAVSFAFRREEVDTERRNAVRLANKAQGIAMAKGSMSGASAGLGGVAQAFASMANRAGEGLSSSLQSIGFNGQQLAQSLLKNPFSSGAQDPTAGGSVDTTVNDTFRASERAYANAMPVSVSVMQAPAAASAASWGAGAGNGVLGSDGSQVGDNNATADTSQAEAYWSGNDGWNY